MTIAILIKYIHFVGIFGVVIALAMENALLKKEHTRAEIKRLAKIDGIYGFSTIIVLAAGFVLWLGVGKPAEFYSTNWILHLKIGLFAVVGILSLPPTIFFMKNRANKKRPEDEVVQIPNKLKKLIRIELAILLILPLLATLMANGIGLK